MLTVKTLKCKKFNKFIDLFHFQKEISFCLAPIWNLNPVLVFLKRRIRIRLNTDRVHATTTRLNSHLYVPGVETDIPDVISIQQPAQEPLQTQSVA